MTQPGAPPWWPPMAPVPPPLTPVQYAGNVAAVEQAYSVMYGRPPSRGMAITSMVLGIVAIVLCWVPLLSYVAVVLAVLALVFGIASIRRAHGRSFAVTGVVLGVVGLVASIALSVVWTRQFVQIYERTQACAQQHPGLGPAFDRCVERSGAGDPTVHRPGTAA